MSQNLGSCPICEKPIQPGEDAVVCPDCGAPYHRECYLQAGQCVHRDKHGTGFEYNAPHATDTAAAGGPATGGTDAGYTSCQNCGRRNAKNGIFCEGCGAPLHGRPQQPQQSAGMPNIFGARPAQAQDMSGEIDGIPKADWATYIGRSAPAYLPRMEQQSRTGGKIGFLFSAFFLPELYYAYRKMWGWATVALVAMALALVPDVLVLAYEQGVRPFSYNTLETIINVAYVAGVVMRMASGLFSVFLYRKSAGRRIKKLRAQNYGQAEYQQALAKKGGVSYIGIAVVFVLVMAMLYLITNVAGYDIISYYSESLFL